MLAGAPAAARPQAAAPKYTRAEYDAYQAAAAEKNPQQKIKLLDDFVAKYPSSELLAFAYNEYVTVYYQQHQWAKDVEYLDKFLALTNVNDGARLQAEAQRAALFEVSYNGKAPDAKDQATKARDAALEGMKVLTAFQKPEQMTAEQWGAARKQYAVGFWNTAGVASLDVKDGAAAADYFSKSLAENAEQPVVYYRLGLADLMLSPPKANEGFWAIARAIALKVPDADKVTKFLRDKIVEYQSPPCDSAIDPQLKELLTLAQGSPNPPAGFSIPGAADLAKAGQRDAKDIIADLRAGGDKAKITWLGVCNGDFPEAFLAKVYEINAADPANIVAQIAIGSSPEEIEASSAPDTTLKISTQPDAARLSKDDTFRFAGKLTGYTGSPFQLTFENVKINPEDIPAEKGKAAPKKPLKKPAGKQ